MLHQDQDIIPFQTPVATLLYKKKPKGLIRSAGDCVQNRLNFFN